MTRIDFYVLQASEPQARYPLACRLLDKAIKGGHQVVVALNSDEQQSALEHALLNHRPESFLPFRSSDQEDCAEPIILDCKNLSQQHDLLLCLGHELPENFSQYQRLIEIVTQDEATLGSTRHHWAFFKERGYPVHHHTL
ncbi:DNA polymerase III subunit chi [Gilvimarinus sp. SDUM040013]|uniref:DNA polymerase III subunit chi n=1 Tax=Gilvimarinus gilvus TaxID=3058038 RepID=A0ABU4RYU5_9GAMM|nr:DNA polymerase III subunit chi [Gilvimarinus sp. SDUM040013]MDO3386300.1 DNA polymerase III subunit chi [Gilvimarinus sp. SDUM040013]MDX6850042.1 DNA polymerase III subunit chi [Gilvimarinus sp. SDUM040013]